MLGCATFQVIHRHGQKHIMVKVIGSMPYPASGFQLRAATAPKGRRQSMRTHPKEGGKGSWGRHAGLCNNGLYTRRHDRVGGHIARLPGRAA